MNERFAELEGGIELCYETLGDPTAPPLLMIMGLGGQLIYWPEGLCELLVSRGLRLIRFDNRDAGRSTWLTELGKPSLSAAAAGSPETPPYLLSEMAGDAVGLLDELEIEAAHVLGASLGGMIAQALAIEHPSRVLSLASLMSTTGEPGKGFAHEVAMPVLMKRPPAEREAYIESLLEARRVIGSPGFERDEDWIRDLAGRAFDRGLNPDGTQRQLAAIIASGDRSTRLRELDVPTVVIHGTADPLIDVSGGEATAAAIPGAELVLIEGLGHDMPAGAWDQIADAVLANVERTQAPHPRASNSATVE
jgi:pimeloyl-ACP methyl ester carboxylesterase